jgi:hypothetical protein
MGPSFVERLPARKFHDVGPATAGKMARLGIESPPARFAQEARIELSSTGGDRTFATARFAPARSAVGAMHSPRMKISRHRARRFRPGYTASMP